MLRQYFKWEGPIYWKFAVYMSLNFDEFLNDGVGGGTIFFQFFFFGVGGIPTHPSFKKITRLHM